VPTFNDLYYAGEGNASLKPEKSIDYSIGAVADFMPDDSPIGGTVDVSYYHIETKDDIVWRPLTATVWLPENYGKILSSGLELSLRMSYEELITLKGNYFTGKSVDISDPSDPTTYQKQQIYIPQQQSSFFVECTPGIFTLAAGVRYIGDRFYTSDNSLSIPTYAVTDAAASVRIAVGSLDVLPTFSVDNLLNRNFEVIPDYPMPPRTYELRVSFQINQDSVNK